MQYCHTSMHCMRLWLTSSQSSRSTVVGLALMMQVAATRGVSLCVLMIGGVHLCCKFAGPAESWGTTWGMKLAGSQCHPLNDSILPMLNRQHLACHSDDDPGI